VHVYLIVNITRFDLYSVILYCCFSGGNRGKPRGKIHFSRLRVRSASLADLRMRICYQSNGGSNISKRENSELYRDYFRNCAPVSLGEQRILIKQVFIYWFMWKRGVQRNPFSKHLLDAHPTAYIAKTNPVQHVPLGRAARRTDASMHKLIRVYHFICRHRPYPVWVLRRSTSYPIQCKNSLKLCTNQGVSQS
jgi:hypothetical protein